MAPADDDERREKTGFLVIEKRWRERRGGTLVVQGRERERVMKNWGAVNQFGQTVRTVFGCRWGPT